MAFAAVAVFNYLLPPPNVASGNSGRAPQASSAKPPEPPSEAGSVTPSPASAPLEPALDGDEPSWCAGRRAGMPDRIAGSGARSERDLAWLSGRLALVEARTAAATPPPEPRDAA